MSATRKPGDLAFVGDVHLDRDDPDLPAFCEFLERLGRSASRIVLMGDLFNLWIGRRELEQPHQTAVVSRLEALRARGVVVRYLEGNRDYGVASGYAGHGFDDVTDRAIVETFGGRRLVAIHGDLTNREDRQYRIWRRFSRSAAVWSMFNLLPGTRRLAIAEALERKMRASNLDFKMEFPERSVIDYAQSLLGPGDDALVLGHFHVEKQLATRPGEKGRVFVLPDWKSVRRHLRVRPTGTIEFVDSV